MWLWDGVDVALPIFWLSGHGETMGGSQVGLMLANTSSVNLKLWVL